MTPATIGDLPSLVIASRILAALVFGTAFVGKARHWTAFTGVIGQYRLLPQAASEIAAGAVLALEAGIAVGALVPIAAPAAVTLGIVLLLGFGVAMAINLVRGNRDIDCGCFQSALRQRLDWWLVGRNAALALVLLAGTASAGQSLQALEWLDGLALGLVLFLLHSAMSAIVALREPAASFQRRFV